MVIIKLKRIGRKNLPFYSIIAINKSSYIKGKYIYKLGYLDPRKKENFSIDLLKINFFIKNGAKLSKRVNNLIKNNIL